MCKRGFPSLRHNMIRDITADLGCTESVLKPLSGESLPTSSVCKDGACLDIAADGFWGSRNKRAFFDVRIFNPFASLNSSEPLPLFIENMNGKRRENVVHVLERWNMVPSLHW